MKNSKFGLETFYEVAWIEVWPLVPSANDHLAVYSRTSDLSSTTASCKLSEKNLMVSAFICAGACLVKTKKARTTDSLCFEIRTIFMACLLSRLGAVWLLFQNFSIACFVWTMSFQSAGERRTDVAPHNTSHVIITKRPCQSWSSQSPAYHRRGSGSLPGHSVWYLYRTKKEKHWYEFFSVTVVLCHLS